MKAKLLAAIIQKNSIIKTVVVCAILAFVQSASANTLSVTTSFDANTKLWTYSYTLDNPSGPGNISDFAILVDPVDQTQYTMLNYIVSSAVPSLWEGPVWSFNQLGHYFEWHTGFCNTCGSLPAGATLSGFSFSIPFGPASDFYQSAIGNVGITGYIDGPSPLSPTFTPLPATLPLFATGLGALGLLGWRRRRNSVSVK